MNAYTDFDDDGPYDDQFELGNDHHIVDEYQFANEPINVLDTCGDCVEGRCHWGGQMSRDSIAAVQNGTQSPHRCGCDRHSVSVAYRKQEAR